LETVEETGSFAATARAHKMSYRHAWLMIDEVNQLFAEPVVLSRRGGRKGGGASLTDWGRRVVTLFRDAEAKMRAAAQGEIDAIECDLAASWHTNFGREPHTTCAKANKRRPLLPFLANALSAAAADE
jgi:molybdate transport system regulatory protein